MKKTVEHFFCDICGKEEKDVKHLNYPVIFQTEQTEGRSVEPYITDKYHIDYDGVICTEVNWETKEFCFTFKGKEYKYKQQGDISCNADTDHIRCVIEEFKEDLMKKEENDMENYIVINGKKTELTEEQLKALGIEVEKKKNNPFERRYDKDYCTISETGDINFDLDGRSICDDELYENVNYFNDKNFANQVYLHELLNRKLLKYAYDNNAEDCEWDWNGKQHYYIFFDYYHFL